MFTRIFVAAIVASAHLLLPAPARSQPKAIGMLILVEGDVTLQRGSTQSRARVADLLYPGDRIVAVSGRATIMHCPSSQKSEIPRDSAVEIGPSAVTSLRGSPRSGPGPRCVLPRVALGAENMERVGALRARPGYKPIAIYTGGSISQTRPLFRWSPVPDATSYHLIVRSTENEEAIVWEHRTSEFAVAFPDIDPPLGPGEYQWELMAVAGGKILAQGTATFEVRPPRERLPSEELPALVRAFALENAGYYSEAAALFRELRTGDDGDERITRRLAWLYWNAGLLTAAGEELRRLEGRRQ